MTPWWMRMARYARPHQREVASVLLLTLALVVFDTLKPWPMKLIIDNVLTNRSLPSVAAWMTSLPGGDSSLGTLTWLVAGTMFLFIAGWLSRMARSYVQAGLGTRMSYGLGADVFDHLQRLSLLFHGRQPTGDLVQRVTSDCTCVRELVADVALPLVTSVASLVAMLVLLWRLDSIVAAAAMLVAPCMGIVIMIRGREMAHRTFEQATLEGRVMGMAEGTLAALPVVQAFGREPQEDARFQALTEDAGRAYLRKIVAQLKFNVSTTTITACGTAGAMALCGIHARQGTLTVGGLLVVLSYVASLYAPIESLAWLSSGFASSGGRARRVLEVLDQNRELNDRPNARPLPHRRGASGHVQVEHVTFGYDAGSPVLRDVTLEARPGEVVAFVGPSGAGKSTLASLLMRFFDPQEGRILLDGIDLRDLQLASLRSQVAIVLQDPLLLPLTVAENIAYGKPTASRQLVVEAARAAQADRFISALPQGYDTLVGERGATLSGGERQRIAIARALLKDAPVLILDEPGSALDTETESQMMKALERLIEGRTTFVIAHRISMIRRATRIAVLEHGVIQQIGSHAELIAMGGKYEAFYTIAASAKPASSPSGRSLPPPAD
jgi:ATP-binding cassette subfamily B protein/subfamily B ATP-binding cassette protein MsbA